MPDPLHRSARARANRMGSLLLRIAPLFQRTVARSELERRCGLHVAEPREHFGGPRRRWGHLCGCRRRVFHANSRISRRLSALGLLAGCRRTQPGSTPATSALGAHPATSAPGPTKRNGRWPPNRRRRRRQSAVAWRQCCRPPSPSSSSACVTSRTPTASRSQHMRAAPASAHIGPGLLGTLGTSA